MLAVLGNFLIYNRILNITCLALLTVHNKCFQYVLTTKNANAFTKRLLLYKMRVKIDLVVCHALFLFIQTKKC